MSHVGVLGALPQEISRLVAELADVRVLEVAGRSFHTGILGSHQVTVVHAHVGKVAAAITATLLVERFGVERLVFTGLAGSLRPEVAVGDVVVATGLVQHDLDASPLFPRFEVPLTGVSLFGVDAVWSARLVRCAEAWLPTRGRVLPKQVVAALPRRGRVHEGVIATGDVFVSDPAQRAQIAASLPRALCVEMEGAAVAQVAHALSVPVVVVRVISDRADGDATDLVLSALGGLAGAYAVGIVAAALRD